VTAEGEDGDEDGAAAGDGAVDGVEETADLFLAGDAGHGLAGAVGGLGDDGVDVAGGETRTGDGALALELHVAGEEDAAALVLELDAGGAGDMAGGQMVTSTSSLAPRISCLPYAIRENGAHRSSSS
jgi:hypothetical protein